MNPIHSGGPFFEQFCIFVSVSLHKYHTSLVYFRGYKTCSEQRSSVRYLSITELCELLIDIHVKGSSCILFYVNARTLQGTKQIIKTTDNIYTEI